MKRERGITLVALAITVIVLIILAGVTLSTLVGDDGIITKAQEAKQNMVNAATEENTLIQNLLNELKGIEEGEMEVPEIPEEPEPPEEPTIETLLHEGDYVSYEDAKGNEHKCVVLYGPENANYSSYGMQIITMDSLQEVSIGKNSQDLSAVEEYNNAISKLNSIAQEYLNINIANSARCVGTMPDNPTAESSEYFVSDSSYLLEYNNIFKIGDSNYENDIRQMRKLEIDAIGIKYWLGSKYATQLSPELYQTMKTGIYVLNGNGESPYISELSTRAPSLPAENDGDLFIINVWHTASITSKQYTFGFRGVFTLKNTLRIKEGKGTEVEPYILIP